MAVKKRKGGAYGVEDKGKGARKNRRSTLFRAFCVAYKGQL